MACGLCCDGTLFDHVNLTAEDNAAALSSVGIELLPDKFPQVLRQRCAAYKNASCTIYRNRPHACRSFRCRLLKAYEMSDIPYSEALRIIGEAVALRDGIKRDLRALGDGEDYSFRELAVRLQTKWKDAVSVEAKDRISNLFGTFAALWMCINKHFLEQGQREIDDKR